MIVFAVLGTLAALLWSFIVVWANGMSDAPGGPYQGTFSLIMAWSAVVVLWLAWMIG